MKPLTTLNRLVNRYGMLFLMVCFLSLLVLNAILFSWLGILPYNGFDILFTALLLVGVALFANALFSKLIGAAASMLSATVSALIVCLIVGPLDPLHQAPYVIFLALMAMASRYIVAWRGKHIFNPAAFTVLVAALLLGGGASWWVGATALLPVTIIGGGIILYKMQRWHVVASFLLTYIPLLCVVVAIRSGFGVVWPALSALVLHGPLLFFMSVMLIEPLTAPARRNPRMVFGGIAAVALVVAQSVPGITYSLELSLLVGNLAAYVMGTGQRWRFTFSSSAKVAEHTTSFLLAKPAGFTFVPGQYMEWSLPHGGADLRGIRRWFTIASSPTENTVIITTRLSDQSSTFKTALHDLKKGQALLATGPEGDFVMPKNTEQPMIWIAGGIGITPFRSMMKYLIDKREHRTVTLFYANKTASGIAFNGILKQALHCGVETIFTVDAANSQWRGEVGPVDVPMIKRYALDYKERTFYISGPEPMVRGLVAMLQKAGVPRRNIKHDYFPGY